MTLIDANALVLLIVGMVDENLIGKHKRTSIYSKQDYRDLLLAVRDLHSLVILPNVWTEVDNLLNRFSGNHRWSYITLMRSMLEQTTERYVASVMGGKSNHFMSDGLTDALLVELGKEKQCDFLITGDSALSDIARANGIAIYDTVQRRNENLRK
ncbi:MAG: hypothetical protein WA958_14870 [Tunicatimonas sp.]